MAWEYYIMNVSVVERWTQKRQAAEIAAFQDSLNEAGRENWEMVGFETVPITGSFSGNIKGYMYLCFMKRQA